MPHIPLCRCVSPIGIVTPRKEILLRFATQKFKKIFFWYEPTPKFEAPRRKIFNINGNRIVTMDIEVCLNIQIYYYCEVYWYKTQWKQFWWDFWIFFLIFCQFFGIFHLILSEICEKLLKKVQNALWFRSFGFK